MSKTTELVTALRCCEHNSCTGCPYTERDSECIGEVMGAAADKIEGLTDRCARYAEEIAVMQAKQKWVDAGAQQPEYGVPVLAVASGKAGNITLCDAVVFATFYDGWELDDYPQAEDVAVKWWMPIVESPEGTEHDG